MDRVIDPPYGRNYEHLASTLVCSLLQHYYPLNEGWIITPEPRQEHGKKPDYVVEKIQNGILTPHIFIEVKKVKGHLFENAIQQIADAVNLYADTNDNYSTFIIVVRGLDMIFLEYYNYRSVLTEDNIVHYFGTIPLTQPAPDGLQPQALTNITNSLPYSLTPLAPFEVPPIFSMESDIHRNHIHNMFEYMKNNIPRNHVKVSTAKELKISIFFANFLKGYLIVIR